MKTLPNDIFIHCDGKVIRMYFELEINEGIQPSEFYSLINPRPYFVEGCMEDYGVVGQSIPSPSSIIVLLLVLFLLLLRKSRS